MVFELLLMEHREPRLRSRSPNRRPTTLGLTLTLRFCNASLAVFHPRFHHVQSCVLTTSFSLHHTPFLRPKTLGSPKHRWPTPHHKCTPPRKAHRSMLHALHTAPHSSSPGPSPDHLSVGSWENPLPYI